MASFGGVTQKDLNLSLNSQESWKSFGNVVLYFRKWQKRYRAIIYEKDMLYRGSRFAKYRAILAGVALREAAKGYFKTWRLTNRWHRRHRLSVFSFWRKLTSSKMALRILIRRSTVEAFRKWRRRVCWPTAMSTSNLYHRVMRKLQIRKDMNVENRRSITMSILHATKKFFLNQTVYNIRPPRVNTRLQSTQLKPNIASNFGGDCVDTILMSCGLYIMMLNNERQKEFDTLNSVASRHRAHSMMINAMRRILTRRRKHISNMQLVRTNVIKLKKDHTKRMKLRFCLPGNRDGLFDNRLKQIDAMLQREQIKHISNGNKYAIFMGCVSGVSWSMQKWSAAAVSLRRSIYVWRENMTGKICQRIHSRVASRLWMDVRWKRWKHLHFETLRIRKARSQIIYAKGVMYWERLYGRIAIDLWRRRVRVLREQHSIAYFFQVGRAFKFLANKMAHQRKLRLAVIQSELKWSSAKTCDYFLWWSRDVIKRRRIRMFIAIREKRLRYANISLLELSPYICTAGDSRIDIEYDQKKNTTLVQTVWTAWKAYSYERLSLIRYTAEISVQRRSFAMWVDATQSKCDDIANNISKSRDKDQSVFNTLMTLAYPSDLGDEETSFVGLGEHSVLIQPCSQSPSNESYNTGKSTGCDDELHIVYMASDLDGDFVGKIMHVEPPYYNDCASVLPVDTLIYATQDILSPASGSGLVPMSTPIVDTRWSEGEAGVFESLANEICDESSIIRPDMSDNVHSFGDFHVDQSDIDNPRMVFDDLFLSRPAPRLRSPLMMESNDPSKQLASLTPDLAGAFPPITPNFEAILRDIVDARIPYSAKHRKHHEKSMVTERRHKNLDSTKVRFPMHPLLPEKENRSRSSSACRYTIDDPHKPLQRSYGYIHSRYVDTSKERRFDTIPTNSLL